MKKLILFFSFFPLLAFGSTSYPWIDLPKEPLSFLGRTEESCFDEIDVLMKEYHSLKKAERENLKPRMYRLEEIEQTIDQCLDTVGNPKTVTFLKNIASIAKKKRGYLREINDLAYLLDKEPNFVEYLCNSIPSNYEEWRPLRLIHERHYDSARGVFWGEYQFEILDPCHRRLTTYYDLWKETEENQENFAYFLLWLEEQNLSEDVIAIHFFSEEEMKQSQVEVIDELLFYKQTHELVAKDGKSQEFIFTIDLDEELYITYGTDFIRHNSLSLGKPVLGAGKLILVKGKVVGLQFQSGHYLPEPIDGLQILDIFQKKGIPLPERTPILFYTGRDKHQLTLEEFLSIYRNL